MPRRRQTRPRPKTKPEPGAVHGDRVYLPEHPLGGRNGWVLQHRVAVFSARNGICRCDAGKEPMDWAEAKVIDGGNGEWLVLCNTHTVIRWLARHIDSTGFGGPAGARLAVDMVALWKAPCPTAGGSSCSEDRQEQQGVPLRGIPGGPAAPVSQEARSR